MSKMAITKQEIEKQVFAGISQQLGASLNDLTGETDLRIDLEADSLDMVEMVLDLEDTFDIDVPDDDARSEERRGGKFFI